MNKVFEPLFSDILEQLKAPEIQKLLEIHVLRPIIATILHIIYPYLLGIMVLWIIMFICVAMILLILVRGSLLAGIK